VLRPMLQFRHGPSQTRALFVDMVLTGGWLAVGPPGLPPMWASAQSVESAVVPRIERTSRLAWEGSSARGHGLISADSGALSELPFSEPSRVGAPEGQTSPEELLAAAHGGCITMSTAAELTRDRTPPERLDVTVNVVMDEVNGSHEIVASHVTIRARAATGADAFAAAIERADAGCPFSRMLKKAGVEVTVNSELEES
jgi:lipoyl-dependent peroxiredoxin